MDELKRQQLRHTQLFVNVGHESVEYLFEHCEERTLERGEHLLEPGAANCHLYIVLEGELRVYLSDRTLPPQAVLGPGECVGEMSLLDGQVASALVLAARDSKLVAIPHEVLWSLVDCSHAIARNLLAVISGRMRDSNRALVVLQERSLEFEDAASVDALTGIHSRHWLRSACRQESHGQSIDAQRRLADADRHALAVLAAGADAGSRRMSLPIIETWFIASGPLPISVAPLTGVADLAVLDQVGLGIEKTNLPLVMSTWPPPKLTA
jgi:CRP-like cAMP-binding protein